MRNPTRLVFILFLLSSCFVDQQLYGQTQAPAAPKKAPSGLAAVPRADASVDSLTLTGLSKISPEEQKAIVKDVEERDYHRDDLKQEIAERVRYQLQNRGYFKVKVGDPEITVLNQTKRQEIVSVKLSVTEGEQYRLQDISFPHASAFSSEELRRQFPIQNGDIFDTDKIRRGLEALRKLYVSKGYVNFTPVPMTQVNDASHTIALNIAIDEGSPAIQ